MQRPVQFELTEDTKNVGAAWIAKTNLKSEQFLITIQLKNYCACKYGVKKVVAPI
jgi:hypothetical protein